MNTPVEQNQFDNVGVARWRTQQFEDRLEQTRNILRPALDSKHAIDWGKRTSEYSLLVPEPAAPTYLEYPTEPQAANTKYLRALSATSMITKRGLKALSKLKRKTSVVTMKMRLLLSNGTLDALRTRNESQE